MILKFFYVTATHKNRIAPGRRSEGICDVDSVKESSKDHLGHVLILNSTVLAFGISVLRFPIHSCGIMAFAEAGGGDILESHKAHQGIQNEGDHFRTSAYIFSVRCIRYRLKGIFRKAANNRAQFYMNRFMIMICPPLFCHLSR